MTRAQQTVSLFLLVSSVRALLGDTYQLYLVCFLGLAPLPPKVQDEIIPVFTANGFRLLQLPFWALVSFGAYLLFKLGFGVFTFNDVPEAYKELMGEIQEAKADLRKKGVDVD
ncbi:dolichol phosphate mannosyltransferase subunit 3 [Rhizodiscina lignyota]|uniref:Dolichol-phosphate mannosyltransferase subunit 3 n=1 Tax=Rhizodiscina lignyota TaxID=1504668 RepID=A0A9P4M5J3_9PEZI|nr:dolichol phosphate mannosyltransferase subunit 3 [Rhizodiscina lignyota]